MIIGFLWPLFLLSLTIQKTNEIVCDDYFRFDDSIFCVTKSENTSLIRCIELGSNGLSAKYEFVGSHPFPVALYKSEHFIYVAYRCGTFERRNLLTPSEVHSSGTFELDGLAVGVNLTPVLSKKRVEILEGVFFVELTVRKGNEFQYRLMKVSLGNDDQLVAHWGNEYETLPIVGYNGEILGASINGSNRIEWLELDTGKVTSSLMVPRLSYFCLWNDNLLIRNQIGFSIWTFEQGKLSNPKKMPAPQRARLYGEQMAFIRDGVFSIANLGDEEFKEYSSVPVRGKRIFQVIGELVFTVDHDSNVQGWNFKKGKLQFEEKVFDIQPMGLEKLLVIKHLPDSSLALSVRELKEP